MSNDTPKPQDKGISTARNRARPVAERFWEKVDICGPDNCWNWTGFIDASGRGSFGIGRKYRTTAARVAYELANGPVPKNLFVCHTCDNPRCCNPNHLFLGTPADNTADMMAKGRDRHGQFPGELNPRAKLTESNVRDIKRRLAAGERRRYIARDYSVTEQQIGHIKAGRSWAHVE